MGDALNRNARPADMKSTMASARNAQFEVRPMVRSNPTVATAKLAAGALAASALLVSPIALWARFGDADLVRTVAVTSGTLLLCWALLRAVTTRYAAHRLPIRTHVHDTADADSYIYDLRNTPGTRDRPVRPATSCGLSRCRPLHVSRSSRDVNCAIAAGRPELRSGRRRTRP
jgi:hypothetical protein